MTLSSVYRSGRRMLEEAGIQDADFDSLCLMEHFFETDRTKLILHGDEAADREISQRFFNAVEIRKTGMPLQYIVGKWNFMGYDFIVGEGVLIPRDDTEIVVEAALEFLRRFEKPKVIDLCSGSGAIAVSIAKMFPNSDVTALEYSELALDYLRRNKVLNCADNVSLYKGDVTACFSEFADESFDLVISNPPYIISDEIDTLQAELQFEPRMALDGGSDGLFFYRSIIAGWSSKVKCGGMIAFEVGEEQFDPVASDVMAHGFDNVTYKLDLQGFKRTVSGIKTNKS